MSPADSKSESSSQPAYIARKGAWHANISWNLHQSQNSFHFINHRPYIRTNHKSCIAPITGFLLTYSGGVPPVIFSDDSVGSLKVPWACLAWDATFQGWCRLSLQYGLWSRNCDFSCRGSYTRSVASSRNPAVFKAAGLPYDSPVSCRKKGCLVDSFPGTNEGYDSCQSKGQINMASHSLAYLKEKSV